MGGAYCFDGQPDQEYSHLQVFSCAALSWVATPFEDRDLPCREGHMSACRNQAVFVMGGEHDPGFLICVNRGAYGVHVQDERLCSTVKV